MFFLLLLSVSMQTVSIKFNSSQRNNYHVVAQPSPKKSLWAVSGSLCIFICHHWRPMLQSCQMLQWCPMVWWSNSLISHQAACPAVEIEYDLYWFDNFFITLFVPIVINFDGIFCQGSHHHHQVPWFTTYIATGILLLCTIIQLNLG